MFKKKGVMNLSPIEVVVRDEREFWERFMWIFEGCFGGGGRFGVLPDYLRELYIEALLQDSKEPFRKAAFRDLLVALGQRGMKNSYHTVSTYKSLLKKAGYLTKRGELVSEIASIRDALQREREYGIRSIQFLFKMRVG